MGEKFDVLKILDVMGVLFGFYFLGTFAFIMISDIVFDTLMVKPGISTILIFSGILCVVSFGFRTLIAQNKEEPEYERIARKYFFTWLILLIVLMYIGVVSIIFPIPNS
ncbi:MAG: hypothetical protein ACTSRW_01440 [Candidatus Helarchaeota archaeon]